MPTVRRKKIDGADARDRENAAGGGRRNRGSGGAAAVRSAATVPAGAARELLLSHRDVPIVERGVYDSYVDCKFVPAVRREIIQAKKKNES